VERPAARFLAFALLPAISALCGCYQNQPASGLLDLSNVPDLVAILIPDAFEGDFGVQAKNSSTSLNVLVTNTGPYAASEIRVADGKDLQAPFAFKGGSFPGTGSDCTSDLAPEAACTLVLTYAPVTEGPHAAVLELSYIDGVIVAPMLFPLHGTTAGLLLPWTPGPVDFGNPLAGATVSREVLVSNNGGSALLLKSANFEVPLTDPASPASPYTFVGGAFPGTDGSCTLVTPLAVGQTCRLNLLYSPLAALDYSDYKLNLIYDDGVAEDSSLTITLNGTAQ